ncbi:MAG: hypothetical protein H6745_16780 [Deltaproteobacteria bacterium]|nr:hypothetical protein [Deltaproteobacteria bacterium]
MSDSSFSARFSGEACGLGECISAGGSVSSSGEVCLEFPIVGYECIDIF